MTDRSRYPNAARQDIVEQLHGVEVADPYRWLEDRDSDETIAWLAAEAELFEAERAHWPTVAHWRQRLETFMGSGSVSSPAWRGDRYFFMRRQPGAEHSVLWLHEADGSERVLVDPNELDAQGLTTLDTWQPSKDGLRLAYQLSVGGNEESSVYVMDVDTGEILEGPIDRARYSPIAWLPGGQAYYYVRRLPPELVPAGEESFHRRVWLHTVGQDPATDVLVFGEDQKPTTYFGVGVNRTGEWLTVSASEGTAPRNDLWVANLLSSPASAPELRPVQVGVDAQSSIRFGRDGRAYLFTDRDAQRGRLCISDPSDLAYEKWQPLVAEDPVAVMEDYAILDDPAMPKPLLLVSWTRHAVAEITVHDLVSGERLGELELPGLGTISGLVERPEGGHDIWFSYTDHVTIPRSLRYDALTGELTVHAYPPGFVQVPPTDSTMITYTSKDGTEIRMMVLHQPGYDPASDSPRPTILYGYGGFGIPMSPGYGPTILSWVEAGGVYAIACLRGGSEEGEWWHRDGMLGKKQNVFDDFIAAAEWLIGNQWTTPAQLAISGGSNGGLLVGAVMTQRPDLFAAVNCSAPLLDMIRYEKFGLGATWNVEYGSAGVAEEFGWLHGYSPLHHVHEGVAYPATLFTVFDQDSRVDPLHARKMCAALQHATSSDRPILIRCEANVGHSARAVSRSLDLSADVLGFTAAATGLSPQGVRKE